MIGECLKAIGLDKLVDRYLPQPKSDRGYGPFAFIQPLLLMLHSGGSSLDDIRVILHLDTVPTADAIGKWLKCYALLGETTSQDSLLVELNGYKKN